MSKRPLEKPEAPAYERMCRDALAPGPELDRVLYASEEDARGLVSQTVVYQAFQMAREHHGHQKPLTLMDPFCGTGSLLVYASTVFRDQVERVIGTDIDPMKVTVAAENIAQCGLSAPEPKISEAIEARVHLQLFENWKRFRKTLAEFGCRDSIPHACFSHDATKPIPEVRVAPGSVDTVITDPPHDNRVEFKGMRNGNLVGSYARTLRALEPALAPKGVVLMMTQSRLAAIGSVLGKESGLQFAETRTFEGGRPGARLRVGHIFHKSG